MLAENVESLNMKSLLRIEDTQRLSYLAMESIYRRVAISLEKCAFRSVERMYTKVFTLLGGVKGEGGKGRRGRKRRDMRKIPHEKRFHQTAKSWQNA